MPVGCCSRLIAAAFACLIGGAAAAREPVEAFYKGKQIAMVVGSSAGGGYDTYARLLARTMGSAIPGNPMIVVQNMSGAGSNRAAGYIYSVAPKDGTAIGAIFPGAVLQPLLSEQPVPHDPSKLVYLGSANNDVYVCYVRSDAPVKTFKDMLSHELIIGASNPGATTYDLPLLLSLEPPEERQLAIYRALVTRSGKPCALACSSLARYVAIGPTHSAAEAALDDLLDALHTRRVHFAGLRGVPPEAVVRPDRETILRTQFIHGAPEDCLTQIHALRETTGIGALRCVFNGNGVLSNAAALAAMRLFAAEVLPGLHR